METKQSCRLPSLLISSESAFVAGGPWDCAFDEQVMTSAIDAQVMSPEHQVEAAEVPEPNAERTGVPIVEVTRRQQPLQEEEPAATCALERSASVAEQESFVPLVPQLEVREAA
jgi:hypothetical protein